MTLSPSPYPHNDPSLYTSFLPSGFNPSEQQGQFFTFLIKEQRSALLLAVAGSGKTTTIVHGANMIPRNFSSRFIAFNKSIASELALRLPTWVESSTFHSAWFRALQRSLPSRPRVDANKVRDSLKKNLSWQEFETYFQFVTRLVGYAKSVGIGALVPNEEREWYNLISYFNLTANDDNLDESVAVRYARQALADSSANLNVIDFDDMLYLPLIRNVTSDKANFIFVDETQDLNAVQRTLLKRMLTTASGVPARVIAVGDPNQAIYGFRGADCDSMERLRDDFNMDCLPLSVSYRCSQAVVKEAQRILNQN